MKYFQQKLNEHTDAGIVLENRRKYYSLTEQFQKWVVKVENTLNTVNFANEEEVQNNYRQLKVNYRCYLMNIRKSQNFVK